MNFIWNIQLSKPRSPLTGMIMPQSNQPVATFSNPNPIDNAEVSLATDKPKVAMKVDIKYTTKVDRMLFKKVTLQDLYFFQS